VEERGKFDGTRTRDNCFAMELGVVNAVAVSPYPSFSRLAIIDPAQMTAENAFDFSPFRSLVEIGLFHGIVSSDGFGAPRPWRMITSS
jgi:hypothetical protein